MKHVAMDIMETGSGKLLFFINGSEIHHMLKSDGTVGSMMVQVSCPCPAKQTCFCKLSQWPMRKIEQRLPQHPCYNRNIVVVTVRWYRRNINTLKPAGFIPLPFAFPYSQIPCSHVWYRQV